MRRSPASGARALLLAGLVFAGHTPAIDVAAKPAVRAVWVFLQPDSARSDAPAAIGEDAQARRKRLGHSFENDRPLPYDLVQRIVATGARLRVESRWLRAVSVDADAATVERLRSLPFVRGVRPVGTVQSASLRRNARTVVPAPRRAVDQVLDSSFYGFNWAILRDMGVQNAQALGFRGENIRIAILDTGFETRHETFDGRRIVATRDFINGDDIVYNQIGDIGTTDQARHGTQVLSLIGGFRPGSLVGPAYDAQFILAKVDLLPGDTQQDEDRWVAAVEWADSLDADIIASSTVFRVFTDQAPILISELDGDGTVTTRIADEIARRDVLFIGAMGNLGPGPGSLASPSDGDSVLSVGALDFTNVAANFSGRGPTGDGRTKPDVSLQGVGIRAASSLSLVGYDLSLSGTSYPNAFVAGGAALLMQAWPSLSANGVARAIRLSAPFAFAPDNARGAGKPDIGAAILFPDGLTPTNVATVDLQGAVTTLAPTFNWRASLVHDALRPVLYRLEVATDSLFNDIVYADTVREAFSLTARQALKPAPRAYWRVRASAALGVTTVSASGVPFSVPRWVRLISPAGNEVTFVDDERPTLSWAPLVAPPPIGPLTYDVEVLSNETGQPIQPALRNVTGSSVRVPQPLVPNTAYRWRVIARTQMGAADTTTSVAPFVITSEDRPPVTLLYQNFPNPFPRAEVGEFNTHIWFDLAETATVNLVVLDLRGRLVRRLIPAQTSCGTITLEPGIYGRGGSPDPADPCIRTSWDGVDGEGRTAPRGVYLLRLDAGGTTLYRRMLFLPQ